ncbi:MAG: NAD(P)/FAD-dependent oxidoreductase, partial [Actinomycetota bacterium]|nr:NAD(P)/FAD-dependent oxidoreductase [Actinomycetota bacterium]
MTEPRPTATDDELREALESANIPTLLMVLAHLTGDDGWLEGDYRPTRTIALDDNDTGGLPEARQSEIREAALGVLAEIRDGRRAEPGPPSGRRMMDLLSASLGERVPDEYAEAMAEDGGFRPPPWLTAPPVRGQHPTVLVIGAGLSGVAIGIALQRLGLPFTIVERNDAVGGTWLENGYPGAGVDTPSHLYSYSFAPRADWSRYYPKRPELLAYVQRVAREAGLTSSIRFGTDVVSARWDEPSASWEVLLRDRDGTETRRVVDVLISAVGLFNQPAMPDLPGLDGFPG